MTTRKIADLSRDAYGYFSSPPRHQDVAPDLARMSGVMRHVPMKPYAFFAVLMMIGPSGQAMAQQLPDAVDLRSAYCARLLSTQLTASRELMALIGNLPEGESKRAILARNHDTEDRHRRLMAYLEPRLKYLDVTALLAASKTADADVVTNTRISEDAGCSGMALQDAVSCTAIALAKSPVALKQQQSANVDWLPF